MPKLKRKPLVLKKTHGSMTSPSAALRNPFKARNFFQSLGFALEGLRFVFKTERNFRIDLALGLLVIALGVGFQISPMEWAPLLAVMALVLFAETMNTAIEFTVDMVTQGEFDMRAKVIKDLSAGACLMCALGAALVGSVIFVPHFLQLLPY
jgi:undecaprenol kinase